MLSPIHPGAVSLLGRDSGMEELKRKVHGLSTVKLYKKGWSRQTSFGVMVTIKQASGRLWHLRPACAIGYSLANSSKFIGMQHCRLEQCEV